jgi:hypothetical protein
MAYVDPNFRTKKEFLAAVQSGESLLIYSPGPFPVNANGRNTVEGPHYPQPHKWYAAVIVRDGIVVSAK